MHVKQPPGFVTGERGQKCQLIKVLYGLHQARRVWHKNLVVMLLANGFEVSESDPALFVKCSVLKVVRLLVHVDYLLIVSHYAKMLPEVKQQIVKEFA